MQHKITRRHLTGTSLLLAVAGSIVTPAFATAQSTPGAASDTPIGTLDERIASMDPAALLALLRTAPVASPLFPATTADVVATPWDDPSDLDLDDALGGVTLLAGEEPEDAVGNYIVFADAPRATTYFASAQNETGEFLTATAIRVEGFDGMTIAVDAPDLAYAVTVIRVANVVAIGGWERPSDAVPDGNQGEFNLATPIATGARWSLVHALALLDHLDTVTA